MTAATGEMRSAMSLPSSRGWSFVSNFDGATVGPGFLAPVVTYFFFPLFVGAGVGMGFFFFDFDGVTTGLAFLAQRRTSFFFFRVVGAIVGVL